MITIVFFKKQDPKGHVRDTQIASPTSTVEGGESRASRYSTEKTKKQRGESDTPSKCTIAV